MKSVKDKLETVVRCLIGSEMGEGALDDSVSVAGTLNAAFLIGLSGQAHPQYALALQYLDQFSAHPAWGDAARFYKNGLELISPEIAGACQADSEFEKGLNQLYSWVSDPENSKNHSGTVEHFWQVFFPEGVMLRDPGTRDEQIELLRNRRKIEISRLNPSPIADPVQDILFTSNILATIPSNKGDISGLSLSHDLKQTLKQVVREDQVYWYDHPIPVGVDPEHNEVLHGLEELDRAVGFEKERGTADRDARLTCVLSASVTHRGLQHIIKEYLENELKQAKSIHHLNIFLFSEADTTKLINDILIPAAREYACTGHQGFLHEILGVDGEYGRHYSFLKAIAAFWHVFVDPGIKGTFKIDLDQVFPQKELVEQSGASAFEHFKTPLWGAEGFDNLGNEVDLGMIAGALVNREDLTKSLFFPDVDFPENEISAERMVFFSSLPQALSTRAEMMTRYGHDTLDGKNHCIQRIHVTGGTCGILVDALRKYRPFTPTFIGRAEDQAYILSVLFSDTQRKLRYVHKDGLIMRHDKDLIAGDAVRTAETGKLVGDYLRILLFSFYTRALPWLFDKTKDAIDPFTGCFVSRIPFTVVYLRFALKAASLLAENTGEQNDQAIEFLQNGSKRLHRTIQELTGEPNPMIGQLNRERQGWDLFYDILDMVQKGITGRDPFALDLQKKARALIEGCRVKL